MIELGSKAKDVITGFTGIVTGRAQYLTGCDQYCITQKASSNGNINTNWFDENRLEVLKGKPIKLAKTDDGKTGGVVANPAPMK